MTVTIKPTVGRIVHFHPAANDNVPTMGNAPLAAQIAAVWDDKTINIGYLDAHGNHQSRRSVTLVQAGEELPINQGYCTWMGYQQQMTEREQQADIASVVNTDVKVEEAPAANPVATAPQAAVIPAPAPMVAPETPVPTPEVMPEPLAAEQPAAPIDQPQVATE